MFFDILKTFTAFFVGAGIMLLVSLAPSCEARAASVAEVCAPHAGLIADAAESAGVPRALLVALIFCESSCRVDAVHTTTGAVGLGQILPGGSAAKDHTPGELADPWRNVLLAAQHLAHWRQRCGTWRGAVEVYNGRKNCRVRSRQGAKVVRVWMRMKREMELKS